MIISLITFADHSTRGAFTLVLCYTKDGYNRQATLIHTRFRGFSLYLWRDVASAPGDRGFFLQHFLFAGAKRRKRVIMPPGEITVTCPACGNRVSLPIAAVKRDNFYCSRCLEKIPMGGIRTASDDTNNRPQPAKPKKSSRSRGRF
jgi:hypothetical protein